MIITREKGMRMWGGGSGNTSVSGASSGGGFSLTVAEGEGTGNAYTDFTYESGKLILNKSTEFVTVDFFNKLFTAYDANGNVIAPNNTTSTLDNIKFKAGAWTEQYLSALGQNSSGGGGGRGIKLSDVWQSLKTNTDDYANQKINLAHIPDLSGTYATKTWVNQQGFLTTHQTLYTLSIYGGTTKVLDFKPNANASIYIKAGGDISLINDTTNKYITLSYTHPTNGANTTISAASGKVLSAITVNNLGHVTSVSSKTLAAADIPSLAWDKITSGKPTTLSGYGITDAKIASGVITLGSNTITPVTSISKNSEGILSVVKGTTTDYIDLSHNHSYWEILDRPTDLEGFGLEDELNTNYVTIATNQTITGTKTFSAQVTANGLMLSATKKIYFGDSAHYIELDSAGFHFSHGVYSDGFVSALGANSSGGGSSTFDEEQMWAALGTTVSAKVIASSHIPNLAASKITSGTLADARIPSLAASKITSGTFDTARIPNLSADKITSGTFTAARIPLATSSARGGVKVGYTTNGKNYAVQLSDEQMYANVPWENTTYSSGAGISISSGTIINNGVRSITKHSTTAYDILLINTGGTIDYLDLSHQHSYWEILDKPTDLEGFGLTDELNALYVTALGTSGNYLTWTKNGSTSNITIPYSTLAGTATTTADTTNTLYVVGVTSSATTTLKRDTSITIKGNALSAGSITTTGNASIGGTLGVTGSTTLTGLLTANGNITTGTDNGAYIQIGAIKLVYDSTNNALKVIKSDNTSANFYATGAVSALGANSSGGGGGGMSLNEVWQSLTNEVADNYSTTKIHTNHIPDMAGIYGYLKQSALNNYVTSVKVGTTAYNPSSGVVSLPAYPTSLPASDVYSWAKASTKPTYTLDEVSDGSTRKLANYLPLSGGTLSGSTDVLKIKSSGENSYVYFLSAISGNTANRASVGYYNNLAYLANEKTYARIGVKDDGTPVYWNNATSTNEKTLWHAGNLTNVSQLANDAGYVKNFWVSSHTPGYMVMMETNTWSYTRYMSGSIFWDIGTNDSAGHTYSTGGLAIRDAGQDNNGIYIKHNSSSYGKLVVQVPSGECSLGFNSGGYNIWTIGYTGSNDNFGWFYGDTHKSGTSGQGWKMTLDSNGNLTTAGEVTASSDARKKNIISNTKFNVKDIASARSVLYEWNDGRDKNNEKKVHGGSIAQDWLGKADSFLSQDNDGWYSINYGALALCSAITIAREVVKHSDEIDRLKQEVSYLKAKVAELEERRA